MDNVLAEALTPVLRELENSGSVTPDVRDEQWSTGEGAGDAHAVQNSPLTTALP